MIVKQISCTSRIIALTLVSMMVAQLAHSAVLQQNGPPHSAIVGSWIETITPGVPGFAPFKSVGVYNQDGTSVFSDQGGVRSSPFPQVYSSAAGSWTYLRDRTFAATYITLVSDFDGNLIGTFKIRQEAILDQSGNRYTARVHLDAFDPDGNLFMSADGTIEARRIVVEALP
jgi:hypothetical protein